MNIEVVSDAAASTWPRARRLPSTVTSGKYSETLDGRGGPAPTPPACVGESACWPYTAADLGFSGCSVRSLLEEGGRG